MNSTGKEIDITGRRRNEMSRLEEHRAPGTLDDGPGARRCAAERRLLLEPVRDATSGQVVGGQLHRDLVAGQDPDAVHSHLARHVGQDLVAIVHLHPEHRVGQRLDHLAFHLDCVFLAHDFSFSPFIGVLAGRPMWMRAEMTTRAPNTMALATWTRRHGQEGADT